MPVPIPQKPQTLRQAKKAYQKASGPRISDAEQRRLRRAEQLQERADRIKDKEKQRRINRKKKEEKEQKERDTRRRMGLETEVKEKLSPRQVRIRSFFGQRDAHGEGGEKGCAKRRKIEMVSAQEEDDKSQLQRKALKELSLNIAPKDDGPANEPRFDPDPKSAPAPLLGDEDWASFFASSTQIEREISGPIHRNPHLPHPPQYLAQSRASAPPAAQPSTHDVAECLALLSSQDLEDYEDYEDYETICPNSEAVVVVAQSQSPAKPLKAEFRPPNPPANPILPTTTEIPLISTQDLAFTEEDLQDLGLTLPVPPAEPPKTPTNPPQPNQNTPPKSNPKPPFADPGDWDLHLWEGLGKENARAHKDLYYNMLADCEW